MQNLTHKVKIGSIVTGVVLAIAGIFNSAYNSHEVRKIRVERADIKFEQVQLQDPENIRMVGKDFLGVVKITDDMIIPAGYTMDMVREVGELSFLDAITITITTPGIYELNLLSDEQPTEEPTDKPTAVPTEIPEEPYAPIDIYISGVGRNIIEGGGSAACTSDNTPVYSTVAKKWGLLVNAHCATKSVINKNDQRVPAYLKSAGEWITPSTADGGQYPGDTVGFTLYWFPNKIGTSTMTRYDAAFIELYDQDMSHYVFHSELPQTTSYYIGTPPVGMHLIGEGRTTKVTEAKIVATGVSVYMRVGYDGTVVHFADQVIYEGYGSYKYVSKPGDSGKKMSNYNLQTQSVCHSWGGNVSGTYGICGLYDWVFDGMHLEFEE